MNLNLPYHSRRDEIGGAISNQEWENFKGRLEGIIERISKKRKRVVRRRKKKGKTNFPRKTLFKPQKKIRLDKDPLWCKIFADESKNGEETESDSEDDILFDLYKKACI